MSSLSAGTGKAKDESLSSQHVYDFLYVDVKRIARLVAQLDGNGILQEITHEISAEGGTSAKVKLLVAEASVGAKGNVTSGDRYDASWRLPVVFLDVMHHLIVGKVRHWRIGQLVELSGVLQLSDFAFAAELLKVDRVRDTMRSGAPSSSTSVAHDGDLDGFQSAVSTLPHMLQTCVTCGPDTVWSTVNDAFMTASTGDLILKFGSGIAGEWTVTGILDALPA